ncbi:UDP-glucuronosyltransferase [Bacillus methanolicus PB1]|uniref:UDP-glucuronosyltransferase n=2 Tax=Bacillus methanolicus TaxID=1471 RepID=I3DV65_BACMT|nr:UDP-glucuronosyltransferase [Bacillus methanolicus PB1]
MQIPSGHHQVADALKAYITQIDSSIEIKKVDIFHYTSPIAEKMVTSLYLKTIKSLPSFYSWLYKNNACKNYSLEKRLPFYELVFISKMKELINAEKPDAIICTHCLPSYLLNLLKTKEDLPIPIVNAYTDYFINNVWGIRHIDYHLVPSLKVKTFLEANGVSSKKIAVTGIPVDPLFVSRNRGNRSINNGSLYHVLVSGGNMGVGAIEKLFASNKLSGKIKFFVLCGKNDKLFFKLKMLNNPLIIPLPYISSRKEMNELYDHMDLILTKPGGVTVSECLIKKIPIYLLDALPGQEEMNRDFLIESGLSVNKLFSFNDSRLEENLLQFLENSRAKQLYNKNLSVYSNKLADINSALNDIILKIKSYSS